MKMRAQYSTTTLLQNITKHVSPLLPVDKLIYLSDGRSVLAYL
jgi:hypothetical protein